MQGSGPGGGPRIAVYRVVDAIELAYLVAHGNYGSSPSRSGKYFALTLSGAAAFAAAPMNAGATITETTLPRSILDQGYILANPGRHGAGRSVYFDERFLPIVYTAMTSPAIIRS